MDLRPIYIIITFSSLIIFLILFYTRINIKKEIEVSIKGNNIKFQPVKRFFGFSNYWLGLFNEREIILSPWVTTYYYNVNNVYMIKILPKEYLNIQKGMKYFFSPKKPTENTSLRNKSIQYDKTIDMKLEQNPEAIIEELTQAAEIVEQGKPYYKE